jgi:hypothetical protein
MLELRGRSWIVIEDLAFVFGARNHWNIADCHDVIGRNCATLFVGSHNPSIGITQGSTRVRLEGCFVYDGVNNGVKINRGAHRNVVSGCTIVKGLSNDGVALHDIGKDEPGPYNIVENCVIGLWPENSLDITGGDYHIMRGNVLYGSTQHTIGIGHSSDNILIQNNIIFGARQAGIKTGANVKEGGRGFNRIVGNLIFDCGYPGLEIDCNDDVFYNNTIVGSRIRPAIRLSAGALRVRLQNNIAVCLDPALRFPCLQFLSAGPEELGVTVDHNLFFHVGKPDGRVIQTPEGNFTCEEFDKRHVSCDANLFAPPGLRAMKEHYFFLEPDSPAVDRGAPLWLGFAGETPDLGWKEIGTEGDAPEYPRSIIYGESMEEDGPIILYLWGKTTTPPTPNAPPFQVALPAMNEALAKAKEAEAAGDLDQAAAWTQTAAYVAETLESKSDARRQLDALMTRSDAQAAMRRAELDFCLERVQYYANSRKMNTATDYFRIARSLAQGDPDGLRRIEELERAIPRS